MCTYEWAHSVCDSDLDGLGQVTRVPALGLLQRGVQRALLGANGREIQPRTTMPMIFTHEGGGHCSFLWAAEPRRTRLATSESPNHTATPSLRERLHSPRPQLGRPCWSSSLSTVTMTTQLCRRCPPHQPMKSLQHRLHQERKVLQRPRRFRLRCAVGAAVLASGRTARGQVLLGDTHIWTTTSCTKVTFNQRCSMRMMTLSGSSGEFPRSG